MAKLTVSLLSLLVLFYSIATNATDVCKQDCSKDTTGFVRCAAITETGKISYSFLNQCQYTKRNSCNGLTSSAIRVDDSFCNNDPSYNVICAVVVNFNITYLTSSQACILKNGSYKQGTVIGVDIGLAGFCAPEGRIMNPEKCSAQG